MKLSEINCGPVARFWLMLHNSHFTVF